MNETMIPPGDELLNSHLLARMLLELPNMPVATHANNHTFNSGTDWASHGGLRLSVQIDAYHGTHVVIGNLGNGEPVGKQRKF